MMKNFQIIFAIILLALNACAQRQRAEYCNLSDVLSCAVTYTNLDDIRTCVATTTGAACELSEEAIDTVNADISEGGTTYTCFAEDDMADEVESRGFSLSHTADPSKNTIYVDFLHDIFGEYDGYTVTRTIQTAIDEADSNTEIILCPGNYYENVTISGSAKDNLVIKNIADGDPEMNDLTVLHSLGLTPVVQISNALSVHLDGLTIQDGIADNGAGVSISLYRSDATYTDYVIISDSVIQDNTATYMGGGIYVEGYNDVKIQNTTITRNSASYGGAIALSGYDGTYKRMFIDDSIISENQALLYGTAFYSSGADYWVMNDSSLTLNADASNTDTIPAIYLAGSSKLSATNIVFSSGADLNLGGDIFNEAQFFAFLEDYGVNPDDFDWTDFFDVWDSLVALEQLSDVQDELEAKVWVYDYSETQSVRCNMSSSAMVCN